MPDPTHELENFGTGGIQVNPLPPSEVRRQGDRRRSRRRAAVVMASVAVVAAVVVPVAALNRGDGTSGKPPVAVTPTPTPVPKVITYPGSGIEVSKDSDTDKLTGTTAAFKSFVAKLARQAVASGTGCPDAFHGVTVQKYSSAGYALGGVNDCGGNSALWGLLDGTWQQAAGTQDQWDCDQLRYFGIPRSFAGPCGNEAGDFGPSEVDGLRLRMTPAAVVAAGGTIGPGKVTECRNVTVPFETVQPNALTAPLSHTVGLAGIFARPGDLTPKGIGLGSTQADVKKAYPSGHFSFGYWIVPLSHANEYQFLLGKARVVSEMDITAHDQDCFG
ncbi:MAG: hypothetical protein JWP74_3882 [Marmoricola sp.]|nr:hypothetical protein [Marmoricola sp.]